MEVRLACLAASFIALLSILPSAVVAQSQEAQTVNMAIDVLKGFTEFRAQSIPQALLANAQGVAIIPNVVKGGFVVAGRFGRGVVLVRNADGSWRAPTFITFGGGSIGWQVGLQSTDVVLVFKNRKGVEDLLSGSEFTLGADAAVAAGPVGRQAAAGTDLRLNAEVYSYSRSRGLFAGVSLDGSVLKVDNRANSAYYGAGGVVPEQALQLVSLLTKDAGQAISGDASLVDPASITATPATPETLRAPLVDASRRLNALLDARWQKFLALPVQLTVEGQTPSRQAIVQAIERFDRIGTDPTYGMIARRVEFQTTRDLLHRYLAAEDAQRAAESQLGQLPPPPADQDAAPQTIPGQQSALPLTPVEPLIPVQP